MKNTSARVYFEGLGRSAFARGLPLNDRRNTRLSWPMFARSAWSRGWLEQGSTNLKKAMK